MRKRLDVDEACGHEKPHGQTGGEVGVAVDVMIRTQVRCDKGAGSDSEPDPSPSRFDLGLLRLLDERLADI